MYWSVVLCSGGCSWKCYKTLTFCWLLKRCTIPCACHAKRYLDSHQWGFFFVVQTMSCLPPMTGNEISISPIYKNGDWGMVPGMVFVRAPKWWISHWETKKSPWQTQDNHVLCVLFSFLDLILDEFQASRSSITVLYDTGVGQSTTESVIWCSWYSTCFNKAIGFNNI